MVLSYTWKIKSIKKQDEPSLQLDDIVVQIYWECTGTDENNISGTYHGATSWFAWQADAENFIPYNDLTEADVIGWVENAVNMSLINEQILKQISAIAHPITEVGSDALPWVTVNT